VPPPLLLLLLLFFSTSQTITTCALYPNEQATLVVEAGEGTFVGVRV
jgi:hypothetical protein